MTSSGQLIDTVDRVVECGVITADDTPCGFVGEVEVIRDFETRSASWACPVCDFPHDAGDPSELTR